MPPNRDEARRQLATALAPENTIAAETLGHIDYKEYTMAFVEWLVQNDDVKQATNVLNIMYQILSKRKVLQRVLDEIKARQDKYRTLPRLGHRAAESGEGDGSPGA